MTSDAATPNGWKSKDGAIVRFSRKLKTGKIAFRQCFDATRKERKRCPGIPVLRGASSALVPVDGSSLYAAAADTSALLLFKRGTR